MQRKVPYLKAGDRVAIAAPARAVSPEEMAPAIATLETWGLQVVVPDGLYERDGRLLYVSCGAGGVVPFRLAMPSEITIITLKHQ